MTTPFVVTAVDSEAGEYTLTLYDSLEAATAAVQTDIDQLVAAAGADADVAQQYGDYSWICGFFQWDVTECEINGAPATLGTVNSG